MTKINRCVQKANSAYRKAIEALETAHKAWIEHRMAQETIVKHPEASQEEKEMSCMEIGYAIGVINSIETLKQPPQETSFKLAKLDPPPPEIVKLIKWRDDLTDQYGSDLLSLIFFEFNDRLHSDSRLPPSLEPALEAFRKLDEETQWRYIKAALPDDAKREEEEERR